MMSTSSNSNISEETLTTTKDRLVRCSSAGGYDEKPGFTARYWAYLFENLERSITEIYNTCEQQENALQCEEVLLILENYTHDFGNLIEWLDLKYKYEHTPQPQRQQGIAWEIRKPSFSALPHTRAYEKLVGINSSSTSRSDRKKNVSSVHSNSSTQKQRNSDSLQKKGRDNTTIPLHDVAGSTTCEIGLQTDLEEDPDVYYFAGGRHVASQTDYNDEFGPLEPLDPAVSVTVVRMDENETSSDELLTTDQSRTKTVLSTEKPASGTHLMPEGDIKPATVVEAPIISMTSSIDSSNASTSVSQGQCLSMDTSCSSSNIEMKSSFTQLSVGVLTEVDASIKVENDGSKAKEIVKCETTEMHTSAEISVAPKPIPNPSTFADKAKTAMLKSASGSSSGGSPTLSNPSQSTTKVLIPPSASILRPTLASKSKVKPVPRSNIASRCRTAVNSNKPSVPVTGTSHLHQPIIHSQQIKQHVSSATSSKSVLNSSLPATAATSSRLYSKNLNNAPGRNVIAVPRPGVSRSKSMINPLALSRMKGKAGSITSIDGAKKPSSTVCQSFMSLPDETKFEKGKAQIDEDGWETVRARSSRSSKRSPSTSSLHSSTATLHSRNSIDKGGGGDDDTLTSSVDYEEIKKKEAALDSAVREEELLEEELLQIEKDFEEIENRATQSGNVSETTEASETENLTSSPEIFLDELENENKESLNKANKRNESRITTISCANPMTEKNINLVKNELDENLFSSSLPKNDRPRAEEFPPREPGRIVTLREKLMSPAKRYDSAETLRRYQAKLEKAERNRERLLQAKYNRYVELSERFESLNETTKRLMEERADLINRAQDRRKRAEQKRQEYLRGIKRKAHDEDSKAREIAFINSIEAQNKRHDYFVSAQGIEERLQSREEERKLKLEERGTKVSAVIERQFRIRNNWEIKLKIMEEKRRQADARIAREKQEKAKERTEMALEKARDREERISALNAAKEAEKEVLQKKIQQRQEDTARRHEENIEHIRQKAVELSGPRTADDNATSSIVRLCTLCNVTMHSEVQELAHVRAKSHMDAVRNSEKLNVSPGVNPLENFGFKFITDVQLDKIKPGVPHDKSRLKVMRKHSKKLMQGLMNSGIEFEEKMKPVEIIKSNKGGNSGSRIQKTLREISRLTTLFNSGKGSLHSGHALDRLLGDARKQAVTTRSVQDSLISCGAFSIAQKILEYKGTDLPPKVVIGASNFLIGAMYQNLTNTIYVLKSSCICSILELVSSRWNGRVMTWASYDMGDFILGEFIPEPFAKH